MLSIDKPISSRSEDFLERRNFADTISKVILNYSDINKSSLTIGLNGKWGSGKTSIVNIITEKLELEEDIIIFKFEPWIFSDTQQLISSFFKELAKKIKHNDDSNKAIQIGEELETYATFFKPMALIPEPTISAASLLSEKIFSGVGKAVKKWGNLKVKNLEDTKKSIEKYIPELKKKILIIIDDIDRLNNTEIRQIFQMIKVLGNFPNTIYLSSMDKEVVIEALSEVQKGNGSEYLEKIINVPFDVPAISKSDVEKFLQKKLNEVAININEDDFDENHWANIFHSGYKNFFLNIRDVIRYINILKFNYSALENKVNIIDLITITAFQVFEPKIYEIIKNNKDYFTGSLPERSSGGSYNKEKIKTFIEESSSQLQKLSIENYIKLIQELFIKIKEIYTNTTYMGSSFECRKLSKICNPELFDTYLTLTLNSNEVSNYDMKRYIKKASNEEEFREIIIDLNKNHKITRFLENLQDYTRVDIAKDKFQNIFNILMDLGDSFPQGRDGMYSISNEWVVSEIFSQLLNHLEEENTRYELIKASIEKSKNSLNIICFEINGYMQEHGEYKKEALEDNFTITNEHLQELKKILKTKIEQWVIKNLLFEHKSTLSILHLWKKLDSETTLQYVKDNINNNENLLKFLQVFISFSSGQASGNYTARKIKNYDYDCIKDFIDTKNIVDRVKHIHSTLDKDADELIKFSVESFLKSYNLDENNQVKIIENNNISNKEKN